MRRSAAVLATAVVAALLSGACAARQVTLTARSGIEQEMLVRALERAVARLDTASVQGKRIVLDMYGLTGDQGFAREFLAARLVERGIEVLPEAATADLRLRVFATILGVDRGETLLGVPALQVPVIAMPIPELPLFKWVRHRGVVEFQTFVFDALTGKFVRRIPDAAAQTKFDQYTLLFVISFVTTDLDQRPPGETETVDPRKR